MLLMYYAPSTLKHQHNTLIDTKISGNRVLNFTKLPDGSKRLYLTNKLLY